MPIIATRAAASAQSAGLFGGGALGYSLFVWGRNSYGQLGTGDTTNRSSPVQLGTYRWLKTAAGAGHSAAIREDGTLWLWGSNSSGQLGDNSTVSKSSPVQLGTASDWKDVFVGANFSFAIKQNGTLWAWGSNSNGGLGNGSTVDRSTPDQIGALTDWANGKMFVGDRNVHFVKADGTLWWWGDSSRGVRGDGSIVLASSPTQIGTATTWVDIGGGSFHRVATRTDGTLWAWGYNNRGQVGNGNITNQSSMVQIGALTDWSGTVAKTTGQTSNAVKPGGSLWGWGRNTAGQIGIGDLVNRSSPVQVGTLTNWFRSGIRNISGGTYFTLSTKNNGTLWAWGANYSGFLGDGTTVDTSSPIQIGVVSSWGSVSCGSNHTLALRR